MTDPDEKEPPIDVHEEFRKSLDKHAEGLKRHLELKELEHRKAESGAEES